MENEKTNPLSEKDEVELLRKKLAENRAERDKEISRMEAEREKQRVAYETRIAEAEREKTSRIRDYENRRAKTVAVGKRSVLCLGLIVLFWILLWLDQCQISVFLLVSAMTLTHLAYYAGTWKLEVYQ